MQEQVSEIIVLLNSIKLPTYKVEKDLGFSNGLLKKGSLSSEKFSLLIAYFEKHAIGIPENNFIYKIYGLINPENDSIFYIGCTRQELHKRLSDHIGECGNLSRLPTQSKKQKIIIALLKSGKRPAISLLEELKNISLVKLYREATKKESDWIIKINPIGNDTRKLPKKRSGLKLVVDYKNPDEAAHDGTKTDFVADEINQYATAVDKDLSEIPITKSVTATVTFRKPFMNDAIRKKLGLKD